MDRKYGISEIKCAGSGTMQTSADRRSVHYPRHIPAHPPGDSINWCISYMSW